MVPPFPSYAAIIDAGSSSSRLFIYQWQDEIELDEPLSIRKVFPSTPEEKKASIVDGGIQLKRNEMSQYLRPALLAGRAFLEERGITDVPLYLLATGGMREKLSPDEQVVVLQAAHLVMSEFRGTFAPGTWANNARVIPGSVEGIYGWVALNYGKGPEEQINGILELGGASMQIAYKVPDTQVSKEQVCLLSGDHRVYSKTWDGFGGDSSIRRMLSGLLAEAGGPNGTGIVKNPCLPSGQIGSAIAGSTRTSVGSGEFRTCLKLSQTHLKEDLATRDVIPSYLDISSFTQHFYGISNYWYSYEFFAKWGAYDINRSYDRKAFTEAVTRYCSSEWSEIPWTIDDKDRTSPYTENRCWYAAWMLTLLHDDKYGMGLEMTQYDTWKNVFRFPTTHELASRSSWTIGAAALIARHGDLSFCPGNDTAVVSSKHPNLLASPLAKEIPTLSSESALSSNDPVSAIHVHVQVHTSLRSSLWHVPLTYLWTFHSSPFVYWLSASSQFPSRPDGKRHFLGII